MSKQTASRPTRSDLVKSSSSGEGMSSKRKKLLAQLLGIRSTISANIKAGKHPFGILLILVLSYFFHLQFGHYSAAALYIFANDGKISGRQQGSVKTRNNVERSFSVPRLVQNAYTTLQRVLLSIFSSMWSSGLNDGERDSWNNVTGVFRSNRFGISIAIKGKQLFVERNINLTMIAGANILAYSGSGFANPPFTSLTPIATQTAGVLTQLDINFAATPSNNPALIYATKPLSAGTSRPGATQYRLIGVMPGATASPFNALTLYQVKYGLNAIADQKIGIALVSIDGVNGTASPKFVKVVPVA